MPQVETDLSLVGRVLEEDVYSRTGLLLLTKGAVLTHTDIYNLLRQRIWFVSVVNLVATDRADVDFVGQLSSLSEEHGQIKSYIQAMDGIRGLFGQVTEEQIPSLDSFSAPFLPLMNEVHMQAGIFRFLYALEGSDSYTYRHSVNVGILSSLIAKLMNKSHQEIVTIGQAGLLHDIGKMLVASDILLKPGKLTDEEFAEMKRHTIYGAQLIAKMAGGSELLSQCALLHHERLDGSGYPEGRKGGEIPIECQIISVADVFDAICSDRIYKGRTSPFEAAQQLWQAVFEGQLNAEIVTKFLHYIYSYYIGSRAVLNSGEEVEIVLIHKDEPIRPLVRKGERYIDLRSRRSLFIERLIV
ncbi:HD-GYP domain-containing protein [Brevibacillus humidisoli]|uniref:HD-GYP domain-containing protein n=1 Tax=Brevibacillus humidisoli TaxID=2895522 RepID=UPI001E574DB1|nr:HD-GYP domain-containing protein [Brevibacillus humidisoli]UFJ42045.1 HD-GYP domain-containing protein [Brevibacillus humidisoli]